MNRPPPQLNYIRSFECAARHLSFTRAAQELGYTQAAISTHIRALEKYLGRDLFVRNARSIELTETGEAFLPTLRQGLGLIEDATDAIVTTRRDRSIVVACPVSLAENWLPACIAAFVPDYPDVEINIIATVWEPPEDHIADITLSVNRSDEVPAGASRLWRETLSLVCDPSLAGRIAGVEDIAKVSKISVAGRQEYWTIMSDALDCAMADLEARFRTNVTNVALELAAHGLGATIAVTSLCRPYLERNILVEPLDIRPESPWAYYGTHRRATRSSLVNRLFEHMLAFCEITRQSSGAGP